MFHKNVSTSLVERTSQQLPHSVQISSHSSTGRLLLLPAGGGALPRTAPSFLFELLAAAAPRCSSFFAEAAVLVLVLALLDRFMVKGRMELNWVVSAFAISLGLLAASVFTDFSSRRWLKRA